MVLLDEPFSSLDAGLRERTRRAVADALAAAGATAVLVTHDQAEALSLADQVAVMRQGRLVQVGAPETVYRSPSDAGVAGFVGEAVLLPASVSAGYATCELGSLAVRGSVDGPARILLRPEQLVLSADGGGVRARVRDVSYFGHDAAVRLELLPGGTEVLARVAGHDRPAPGSVVRLSVAGDALAYPGDAPLPAERPCRRQAVAARRHALAADTSLPADTALPADAAVDGDVDGAGAQRVPAPEAGSGARRAGVGNSAG